MEEELNENDLEERLYAMIHHVDGTQADENTEPSQDAFPRVEEAPRSTVKRYWRTSHNSTYQKINTPKDAPANKNTLANVKKTLVNKSTPATVNRIHAAAIKTPDPKPKEEKNDALVSPSSALAILQNTAPQNFEKSVVILDNDGPKVFSLESSDEDEVIEVALPPKPTITIESSDDDELIVQIDIKSKDKANNKASKENKSPNKSNRDVPSSPVPSVVSSMSDDFIRGDCIALNISSAQPDDQSFDFSLHGSDLLGVGAPSKRKKKKKSKDRVTSTPIAAESTQKLQNIDNIFATPKSKAKNKRTKTKSYAVSEKIIPNADVYDSDSNQSVIDINKNHDAYIVTEKSFPSADVYESDSSVTENIRGTSKQPPQKKTTENDSSDSNASMELSVNTTSKNVTDKTLIVDLTHDNTILDKTGIEENIVIGNVSGYSNVQEYGDNSLIDTAPSAPKELGRFCSTKVPQILYEDLDFDNLKGKDKVCKRRRYSLTTLRAEMEKFYNESWGGENFNHQEIQKNMSRDKSLWVIDPKDRMPNPPKRRVTCNYCNRVGHRDDTCRLKPPVCHMCGITGHYEPRCPKKICVNCGSPNFMYSTMCRNCAPWRQLTCAECGQPGHPASHCPDMWRRYHNTIDENMPLEACSDKPQYQLQCSGCARRGHLAHACRSFVPLCSLPLHSPRVARYWRLYPPTLPETPEAPDTPTTHYKKRPSESPTVHETHVNKKRMTSESEPDRSRTEPKQTKNSQSADAVPQTEIVDTSLEPARAPDFISVGSNHDKRGQVIQDNEVSDTSEVRTEVRLYLSKELFDKLRTRQGQEWMTHTTRAYNVEVYVDHSSSFLTIVGTLGDQEAFRSSLRAWKAESLQGKRTEPRNEENVNLAQNMPKKKKDVLHKLNKAFESLKGNIGDPQAMFKELTFLQNRHHSITSMKIISPQHLNNNRKHITKMLKKLNMVLLGQAGLAGGAERLNALHYLQEKVTNIRNNKVPLPLRTEIGQHYETIFTGLQRDDYKDLVQMFYSKQTKPIIINKETKSQGVDTVTLKKKKKKKKSKKAIARGLQINPCIQSTNKEKSTNLNFEQQAQGKPDKVKRLLEQLKCFHSKLLKNPPFRPNVDCYRIRNNMANKIHTQIMSLNGCVGQTKLERHQHVKNALRVQREARQLLERGEWKGYKAFLEKQTEN